MLKRKIKPEIFKPDAHFYFAFGDNKTMVKSDVYKPDTFLYFAYGENLFNLRIRMHNPSAEFVSIARLDNYRLDFIKYSHFWGGPSATLVPTANAQVWGVIWRLHQNDKITLDEQKGVDEKKYYIKYVNVHTPYIGSFTCRTYIQKVNPLPRGERDQVPVERWPSWAYKQVMIMGALEHTLPPYYIQHLKLLKHNGEEGGLRTGWILTKYAKNEPCQCRVPGRIPREPLKMDLNKLRSGKERKR